MSGRWNLNSLELCSLLENLQQTCNIQVFSVLRLKQKCKYSRELSRKMKRLCSSCLSIHPFLPLPILSCFPSLCFFLSFFPSVLLPLFSRSLQTFLRPWVRREKNRPHSLRKPKRFLIWVCGGGQETFLKMWNIQMRLKAGDFQMLSVFSTNFGAFVVAWLLSASARTITNFCWQSGQPRYTQWPTV